MANERDDLESYRAQVVAELECRVDRVRRIDGEIAAADFRLESLRAGARIPSGNTGRLLTQVALRDKIRRERLQLERERTEAVEDVKRAQERLEQVDGEIEQGDGGSHELDDAPEGDED